MPGVRELFGQALRVERAMLLDWRGSHQNLDHITLPDISNPRSLIMFVLFAHTDRYGVCRALIPKNVKVNTADTAICTLDWTRRMLDTGTRLDEVVLLVKESSVVGERVVREAWTRLLRQSIMVHVEGECSEMIRACLGCAGGEPAGRRDVYYEL
ncbi:hypothetical protein ARMGADRAFT_281855 [Armillaria gallica]|uniref:Uncharacterized protein n=1 Tax=Armillaria gallica TaxID=47427 RepID=A0A2H3DHE2_ARMGA|nr:hypothetical protein ARMGADRAFT_281855 [Armillaria gallica]